MENIFLLFDVWGVQRPITSSYKLKKAPVKKGNSFAVTRHRNQWRNGVGVVSKQLKQGARFHLFLCFSRENKLKTCRIPGVGPIEDIYKVILLLFHVFRPSSPRLGHCMIAVHHYKGG